MSFNFKDFRRQLPDPRNRQAVVEFYGGMPSYRPSRSYGWVHLDPAWIQRNISLIPASELPGFPPLPGGQRPSGLRCNNKLVDFVIASWAKVYEFGLHDKIRTYDGMMAERHMGNNPNRPLSWHAFGIAWDFDAAWAPYRIPLDKVTINRDFVRVLEECGWAWGGRWDGGFTDGMHFEALQPAYASNIQAEPVHAQWPPEYTLGPIQQQADEPKQQDLLLYHHKDGSITQEVISKGSRVMTNVATTERGLRYHVRIASKES